MERETKNETVDYEFLSQSYSEGIERIIGTQKDSALSFCVPPKVIEKRKKYWDGFFDKYSQELSDDIGLFVHELNLKNGSDKIHRSEQRVPMRKSRNLVQYWIDTGNPPCKALLYENEYSESGSSLSEKEFFNSPASSVNKKINSTQGVKDKLNVESSCSSVDTAAYILSNTNVTKKAQTIAIVEGAKQLDAFEPVSSHNLVSVREVDNSLAGKKTLNASNGDVAFDSNDNKYTNSLQKITSSGTMGNMIHKATTGSVTNISRICTIADKDTVTESNEVNELPRIDLSPVLCNRAPIHKESVEDDLGSTNEKDGSVGSENGYESTDGNSSSTKDDIFTTEEDLTAGDGTLKIIHRKKLYSGRDSPVDLMLMKSTSGNRMSKSRQSLHPALDPVLTAKWRLLKKRKVFGRKKKKRSSFLNKSFESYDNSASSASNYTEDEQTEDSLIQFKPKRTSPKSNGMMKKLQEYTSLMKSNVNNTLVEEKRNLSQSHSCNDIEMDQAKKNGVSETGKKESPSATLNPVIQLERIANDEIMKYKSQRESTDLGDKKLLNKNNGLSDQSSKSPKRSFVRKSKEGLRRLHSSTVQNIDSEDVGSNASTLLICECNISTSHEFCAMSDSTENRENCAQKLRSALVENDNCSSGASGRRRRTINASKKLNSSYGSMRLRKRLNRSLSDKSSQGSVKNTGGSGKEKVRRKLRGSKETKIMSAMKNRKAIIILRRLSPEILRKHTAGLDLNTRKSSLMTEKNTSRRNATDEKHTLHSRRSSNYAEFTAIANTATKYQSAVDQSVTDNSELIFTRTRGTNIRIHEKEEENHVTNILSSSDEEDEFLKLIEHSQPKKRMKLRADSEMLNDNSDSIVSLIEKSRPVKTSDAVDDVNGKPEHLQRKTRQVSTILRNNRTSCFVLQSSGSEDERSLRMTRSRMSDGKETANNSKNNKYVSFRIDENSSGNVKCLNIMSSISKNKDQNLSSTIGTRSSSRLPKKNSFNDYVQKNPGLLSSRVEVKGNPDVSSRKSKMRLRFQTRLFDSDSESLSLSSSISRTSERD